jgi:hypothetical protein
MILCPPLRSGNLLATVNSAIEELIFESFTAADPSRGWLSRSKPDESDVPRVRGISGNQNTKVNRANACHRQQSGQSLVSDDKTCVVPLKVEDAADCYFCRTMWNDACSFHYRWPKTIKECRAGDLKESVR